MKVSSQQVILVIVFLLLIVGFSTLLPSGTLFFIIPGVENNQLLNLGTGSLILLEGSNDPDLGTGTFVTANFNVAGGNDIAAIGSVDKDDLTLNKAGYTNPTFYFAGQKTKMNTILPFESNVLHEVYRVGSVSRQAIIINVAYFKDCQTLGDSLVQIVKDNSNVEFGSRRLGVAISGVISERDVDFLGQKKTCFMNYDVIVKDTSKSFKDYKYLNKYLDWELKFQMYNKDGVVSSEAVLNKENLKKTVTANGVVVGKIFFDSFSFSGYNLPVDISSDSAMYYNGSWGNADRTMTQTAFDKYSGLKTKYDVSKCISFSGCIKDSSVDTDVALAESSLNLAINSLEQTIGGKSFTPQTNKFVFNESGTFTPKVFLIAKADWIGIVKSVPELTMSCSGTSINITEGDSKSTVMTVKNISSVAGSYAITTTCPISFNVNTSINAGATKTHSMNWSSAFSGSGSCEVALSYDGKPVNPCNINYNITKKLTYICKNDICESGLGENATNCFYDCGTCPTGQEKVNGVCVNACVSPKLLCNGNCINPCTAPKVLNEFCQCVEVTKCGNNVIDVDEDCSSCKADVEAEKGTGYCDNPDPEPDVDWIFILSIIGGIIVIGGIAYFTLIKREKGRR